MSLEQLLRAIRASSLILLSNARLWAPNTHVSLETRRAIMAYRRELLRLIAAHDVAVCPNPGLHRPYWRYAGEGRFECEICAKIVA